MLVKVTSDLFDIANRLRQIDERYHLFWNGRDYRFEVHSSEDPNMLTHEFNVRGDLDAAVIEHALETRAVNENDLRDQIDTANRETEMAASRTAQSELRRLEDMFQYASQTSHEITFKKRRKWI